jgi:hypothetical protein
VPRSGKPTDPDPPEEEAPAGDGEGEGGREVTRGDRQSSYFDRLFDAQIEARLVLL